MSLVIEHHLLVVFDFFFYFQEGGVVIILDLLDRCIEFRLVIVYFDHTGFFGSFRTIRDVFGLRFLSFR